MPAHKLLLDNKHKSTQKPAFPKINVRNTICVSYVLYARNEFTTAIPCRFI